MGSGSERGPGPWLSASPWDAETRLREGLLAAGDTAGLYGAGWTLSTGNSLQHRGLGEAIEEVLPGHTIRGERLLSGQSPRREDQVTAVSVAAKTLLVLVIQRW